jgi:DNA-binding NtrC family response regulator
MGVYMKQPMILVVDDDEVARKNLIRLLSRFDNQVSGAKNGTKALSLLSRNEYDVVLTDLVMDDMNGLEVLAQVKQKHPGVEVIVITGYASIPTAIEAIKNGAYHYLEKPFRPEEIRHLVGQAIEKRQLRKQVRDLEARLTTHPEAPVFICRNKVMAEIISTLKEVAQTECKVILTGESGTGKELAASLVHHHSRRREGRFLAINCGAFSEELLANELFGHEKGAFTGASTQKAGLLEAASGGTLLLDEIGDMPVSMQVKLLRAIEEQEVIRVGGNRPIAIDVRILAATNQDLKKAVDAGLFRHDLYYRLNVVSIRIPPLRERKDDILLLSHYFLDRAVKRLSKEIKSFSDQAMKALVEYNYPGNVRELENIVERAVAMARDDTIQVNDLPPDLSEMSVYSFEHEDSKIKTLREIQRDYIQWVLNRVGRNKTKAAKFLGIDRASLWRHLKHHEILD